MYTMPSRPEKGPAEERGNRILVFKIFLFYYFVCMHIFAYIDVGVISY